MRNDRRFVVGTAGHVDHGKTSLVRALTGVDTDRLPEEKRRGITIELGFAELELDGAHASFIDVPGHKRFVHTMIAGAMGIEAVLFVVAADEGVMPQTREHAAICDLIGVKRAVIAVTKFDAVDADLAEVAASEARELLAAWKPEVVKCSAVTGQGIDTLRGALRRMLASCGAPPASKRARLSVDRVFSVKGAGTVVTGTLVEGKLEVGARLRVIGRDRELTTAARALEVHGASLLAALAPTRLAINVAGLAHHDVHRGDVVTDDPHVAATSRVEVELREGAAVRRGAALSIYVGTSHGEAHVDTLDAATRVARLTLHPPLVIVGGDRIVLRGSDVGGSSGAVVGGGVVLDAAPPARRTRDKRTTVRAALAARDAEAAVRALVVEASPRPLRRIDLACRFAIDETSLVAAAEKLEKRGELVDLAGLSWIDRGALTKLAARARELVAEHARRAPLDRGLPLGTLREKLAAGSSREAADAAIALGPTAGGGDAIVIDGDIVVRKVAGGPDPEVEKQVASARRAIDELGPHGATEHAILQASGASTPAARAILARLVREGHAVHAGDLWFSRALVDEMQSRAVKHLAAARGMTVIEFKQVSGLPRKQAILLLEHFDRLGVTRRNGDVRVLVAP